MKVPSVFDRPTDLPEVEIKCPICGKPSVFMYKPFCSKRCADIDLGRWMNGVYSIPSEEEEEIEEKK